MDTAIAVIKTEPETKQNLTDLEAGPLPRESWGQSSVRSDVPLNEHAAASACAGQAEASHEGSIWRHIWPTLLSVFLGIAAILWEALYSLPRYKKLYSEALCFQDSAYSKDQAVNLVLAKIAFCAVDLACGGWALWCELTRSPNAEAWELAGMHFSTLAMFLGSLLAFCTITKVGTDQDGIRPAVVVGLAVSLLIAIADLALYYVILVPFWRKMRKVGHGPDPDAGANLPGPAAAAAHSPFLVKLMRLWFHFVIPAVLWLGVIYLAAVVVLASTESSYKCPEFQQKAVL